MRPYDMTSRGKRQVSFSFLLQQISGQLFTTVIIYMYNYRKTTLRKHFLNTSFNILIFSVCRYNDESFDEQRSRKLKALRLLPLIFLDLTIAIPNQKK